MISTALAAGLLFGGCSTHLTTEKFEKTPSRGECPAKPLPHEYLDTATKTRVVKHLGEVGLRPIHPCNTTVTTLLPGILVAKGHCAVQFTFEPTHPRDINLQVGVASSIDNTTDPQAIKGRPMWNGEFVHGDNVDAQGKVISNRPTDLQPAISYIHHETQEACQALGSS